VQVVQLAWLLTHDAVAAEDIAHDAFAALLPVFGRVDNPAAYLRRSVVNGVYQRSRSSQRERRRLGLVAAGAATATSGPTGGVADIVARLPIDQRTAVVLRYWEELQHGEIADAMGIRPGTARSARGGTIGTGDVATFPDDIDQTMVWDQCVETVQATVRRAVDELSPRSENPPSP